MAEDSKIQWTKNTFNPWWGCTRVSPGCKFCYAEALDGRYHAGVHWGPGAPRKIMSESYWYQPIKWNKAAGAAGERQRVFCASMADVFDKEAPEGQRDRLYDLVRKTPNLDWLFLTKRIELAKEMLPADWGDGYPNVWIGATTETQDTFDERIPILRDIKAKVKFLSVEPQIGEINFGNWMDSALKPFNWMIFGGESESKENARPFDPEWVKAPMEKAKKNGVAVFVKQMGSAWAHANKTVDKKGGDPAEWPEWLRVREFPV